MATVSADVWLKTRVFSDLSHMLAQNALHHCEGQLTHRFEAWAKKNDLRAHLFITCTTAKRCITSKSESHKHKQAQQSSKQTRVTVRSSAACSLQQHAAMLIVTNGMQHFFASSGVQSLQEH